MSGARARAQELQALTSYTGDRAALSGAEQFMLTTATVPRFAAKLQAVVFAQQVGAPCCGVRVRTDGFACGPPRAQFDAIRVDVESALGAIKASAMAVVGSARLKAVLEMILAVGVAMSGGRGAGGGGGGGSSASGAGVRGLRLAAINKLAATKSVDRKSTLMDYVVSSIMSKGRADLARFMEDLTPLKAVRKLLLSEVQRDLAALANRTKHASDEAAREEAALAASGGGGGLAWGPERAAFVAKWRAFAADAGAALAALRGSCASVEAACVGLAAYFGEDVAQWPPQLVFGARGPRGRAARARERGVMGAPPPTHTHTRARAARVAQRNWRTSWPCSRKRSRRTRSGPRATRARRAPPRRGPSDARTT